MFCTRCGFNIPEDMAFCLQCGAAANDQPQTPSFAEVLPVSAGEGRSKKRKHSRVPLVVVLVIIVVLAAALAFLLVDPMGLRSPLDASESPAVVEPTPLPQSTMQEMLGASYAPIGDNEGAAGEPAARGNPERTATMPRSDGDASQCILPDSASRYYTESDLAKYSNWELYVARNEIFARHGREFRNKDLAEHFAQCDWYTPTYSPEAFDAKGVSMLNEYEAKNVETIKKVEQARNSSYLS